VPSYGPPLAALVHPAQCRDFPPSDEHDLIILSDLMNTDTSKISSRFICMGRALALRKGRLNEQTLKGRNSRKDKLVGVRSPCLKNHQVLSVYRVSPLLLAVESKKSQWFELSRKELAHGRFW
jgi:hypothetical protein